MAQCNIERSGGAGSGGAGFITANEIQNEWTQVSLGNVSNPKLSGDHATSSSKYMVAILHNNIYTNSAIIFTHDGVNTDKIYNITIGDPDAGYDKSGYINLQNDLISWEFKITTSTGNSLIIPRNNSLYVKEYT